MDALRGLGISSIRQRLFPQPVVRRLQHPHASIAFADLDSPEYVATLLLFYDNLVVEGCRRCITPQRLPFASDLIDRGLIVPLPLNNYETYGPEALNFLEEYQDHHISPQAQGKYVFAVLNPSSIPDTPDDRVFCRNCVSTNIRDTTKTVPNIDPEFSRAIDVATRALLDVPSPMMMRQLNSIRGDIRNGNKTGVLRLAAQAKAIGRLEYERAFESVHMLRLDEYETLVSQLAPLFPDLHTNVSEMVEFCALGLRVDFSPGMQSDKYLDVVQDYRGTLRNVLRDPSDPKAAIVSSREVVSQLNSQIREMAVSKRYKTGSFVFNIAKTPNVIKFILRFAIGTDHGLTQTIADVLDHDSKPTVATDQTRNATKAERFLSIYFGKSIPTVQLWNLQKKVSKLRPHSQKPAKQ